MVSATAKAGGVAVAIGAGIGGLVAFARRNDEAPTPASQSARSSAVTAGVSTLLVAVGAALVMRDVSDFPAIGVLGAILAGASGATAAGAIGYSGAMLGAHLLQR